MKFYPGISHHPMASHEALGAALRHYLEDLAAHCPITADEEKTLAARVGTDPFAREKLITANLQIVVAVAKLYLGRGVDIEDLIQEGNLGLMTAVDRFDVTRGFRLTSYATWWIHQAMQRALGGQGTTIRLPFYFFTDMQWLNRVNESLRQELGRPATRRELAEAMDVSLKEFEKLIQAANTSKTLSITYGVEGIYDGNGELQDDPRMRRLSTGKPSRPPVQPDVVLASTFAWALCRLTAREEMVLRMRFGIGHPQEHEWVLEEIGELFGLTRERVRQLEASGLARLRQIIQQPGQRRLPKRDGLAETYCRQCLGCGGTYAPPEAQPAGHVLAPVCSAFCGRAWWRRQPARTPRPVTTKGRGDNQRRHKVSPGAPGSRK